jgi:polyisoprenoid-binding protein YceI
VTGCKCDLVWEVFAVPAVRSEQTVQSIFRFCLGAALIALTLASAPGGEVYEIDGGQSSVSFAIHQFLGTTRGKFSQLSGTVEIDRAHPEHSLVRAVIAVKSIDTGIAKRDEHLRSPSLFDAAKYPQITFQSRSLHQTGPQAADVLGDLTMHGVTRQITLHVKALTPLNSATDPARMRWLVHPDPIKRSDFGLLFSRTAEAISGIGQEVTIEMSVTTKK